MILNQNKSRGRIQLTSLWWRFTSLWCFFSSCSFRTTFTRTYAYPVVAHIDEESERCFRFNVRTHDEAHVAVLVLPNEEQFQTTKNISHEELELWYVQQLYELSQKKNKKQGLPRNIAGEAPETLVLKQSEFKQDQNFKSAPIMVTLTSNPAAMEGKQQNGGGGGASGGAEGGNAHSNMFQVKYFIPLVINHVKKRMRGSGGGSSLLSSSSSFKVPQVFGPKVSRKEKMELQNLEGYGLCFKNTNNEHALHVVFDIVLDSDPITDSQLAPVSTGSSTPKTDFDKSKHLSPLERSLDQSINAAQSVLREMKYMEKREQRMRQTADNINARVRYFSYVSIGALLVITYIQIGYLKRYFHKKKLL